MERFVAPYERTYPFPSSLYALAGRNPPRPQIQLPQQLDTQFSGNRASKYLCEYLQLRLLRKSSEGKGKGRHSLVTLISFLQQEVSTTTITFLWHIESSLLVAIIIRIT